jgi:hypothetical protein
MPVVAEYAPGPIHLDAMQAEYASRILAAVLQQSSPATSA